MLLQTEGTISSSLVLLLPCLSSFWSFHGEHAYCLHLLKSNVSLWNYPKSTTSMEPFLNLKVSVLSAFFKFAHLFLPGNIFPLYFASIHLHFLWLKDPIFYRVGGEGSMVLHPICPWFTLPSATIMIIWTSQSQDICWQSGKGTLSTGVTKQAGCKSGSTGSHFPSNALSLPENENSSEANKTREKTSWMTSP